MVSDHRRKLPRHVAWALCRSGASKLEGFEITLFVGLCGLVCAVLGWMYVSRVYRPLDREINN